MYEHKILCFLEYEEDDDEEDDEEKWKNGYFIQMTKKNDDRRKNRQTLQPRPTEDEWEIFADISNEKWWYCMFIQLKTIKSFSFVPVQLGTSFISIIWWD